MSYSNIIYFLFSLFSRHVSNKPPPPPQIVDKSKKISRMR